MARNRKLMAQLERLSPTNGGTCAVCGVSDLTEEAAATKELAARLVRNGQEFLDQPLERLRRAKHAADRAGGIRDGSIEVLGPVGLSRLGDEVKECEAWLRDNPVTPCPACGRVDPERAIEYSGRNFWRRWKQHEIDWSDPDYLDRYASEELRPEDLAWRQAYQWAGNAEDIQRFKRAASRGDDAG